MSVRSDVLLWAQRVIARKQAPAHEVLECEATADIESVQKAFHKLARMAHPDLHRNTLTADELELVTSAYSRAASAYAELRSQRMKTTRIRPFKDVPAPTAVSETGAAQPPASASASGSMSSKALVYFRKAEAALRRGDLTQAVLQLKMAIAADPQSTFLRTALGEVEAELRK
ncbi:MAG TPA: J domain-containing protein [Kofleriaceae bacterium]